MNILKTVLLVFGVSLLVSACAEDTIGNNGSAGSVDAKVAPTLAGPYIGDNSTYGNNSQDYSYMKELVKSKRYWFANYNIIYSGLFTGEHTKGGHAILIRRNGDLWSISIDNIYDSRAEILKRYKNCKYVEN